MKFSLMKGSRSSLDPWYSSTYFTPDVPFYQHDGGPPQVAGGVKPGETLSIGHGSSGVDPFRFVIADDLSEDRTYFRIILTTSPADFSMLSQTYNPAEPSPVLSPSLVTSKTARTADWDGGYTLQRARGHCQNQQRRLREDSYYFSTILTVRQLPFVS